MIMANLNYKYSLTDFTDITFVSFNYNLPEETIQMISNLSLEVGSPSYIKTPVFRKKENPLKTYQNSLTPGNSSNISEYNKKKRGNKNMEIIHDEDWETLRSFQTTKIEKRLGIESHIDIIRSYLNKLTDKNYSDITNKIFDLLQQMVTENCEEMNRISFILFEIASTNRFYSKIYADFYSEVIQKYENMQSVFQESFDTFLDLFHHIEYVDASLDYDKFCKINKDNEKRKALSAFFINLMINRMIPREKILEIIQNLLLQIYVFISLENKKNEVDELTENVVLLLRKDLFTDQDYEREVVEGKNISQMIEFLANSKVKDFKSLTNKSVFKFMDMIDM